MDSSVIEGIMVRAAAMEVKYCDKDGNDKPLLIAIPIRKGGVHKDNRGSVYTQGKAVVTLFQQLPLDSFLHRICQRKVNCNAGADPEGARGRS